MSIGILVNRLCDLFLPDVVGDLLGTVVDGVTGNVIGAVGNGVDALGDVFELCSDKEWAQMAGMVGDELGAGLATVSSPAGLADLALGTAEQVADVPAMGLADADAEGGGLAVAMDGGVGAEAPSRSSSPH